MIIEINWEKNASCWSLLRKYMPLLMFYRRPLEIGPLRSSIVQMNFEVLKLKCVAAGNIHIWKASNIFFSYFKSFK